MDGAGTIASDGRKEVTIHPRITQEQSRAGLLLAGQHGQRPMTFWSGTVAHGLLVAAALGIPNEHGLYGPWSGKQLARLLRMTVAQLIEFQIQHGETPAILALLQRHGTTVSVASSSSRLEHEQDHPPASEVFASSTSRKEVQLGLKGVGFGQLSILVHHEAE